MTLQEAIKARHSVRQYKDALRTWIQLFRCT